jgi:hypothetical protein
VQWVRFLGFTLGHNCHMGITCLVSKYGLSPFKVEVALESLPTTHLVSHNLITRAKLRAVTERRWSPPLEREELNNKALQFIQCTQSGEDKRKCSFRRGRINDVETAFCGTLDLDWSRTD